MDNYHGTKVSDPYRWLEDPNAPETQAWVRAENRLTTAFLSTTSVREKIKTRLTRLWNYPKYSVPIKHGERYFFWENDGLQNQPVFYMQKGLNAKPAVIIDPNKFSEDGIVAVTTTAFSNDGKLLVYAISHKGSDWQELRIRHIDSGDEYAEVIRWCKFVGIAWQPDNEGFYYNRLPEPGTVAQEKRDIYRVCPA